MWCRSCKRLHCIIFGFRTDGFISPCKQWNTLSDNGPGLYSGGIHFESTRNMRYYDGDWNDISVPPDKSQDISLEPRLVLPEVFHIHHSPIILSSSFYNEKNEATSLCFTKNSTYVGKRHDEIKDCIQNKDYVIKNQTHLWQVESIMNKGRLTINMSLEESWRHVPWSILLF